jgi:alpha-D-ribose 1-methylphosphonate 5-triphosphate synthase subunit PhnL
MMEMTMINETDDAGGDIVGVYVDGVLQNAVADGYYHG